MPSESESTRYAVVYIDKFTDPELARTARNNLCRLFNLKQQHLTRLASGDPVVIKKQVNRDTAEKYRDAVVRAGGVAWIQALGADGRHYERRQGQRRKLFDRRAFYRISAMVPDRRVGSDRRSVDRAFRAI